MKPDSTLILSGGGLRSLVTLAQALALRPRQAVTLLHVRDGREAAEARRRHVLAQAEHYHVGRVLVIDMPWLTARPWARRSGALRHNGVAATRAHPPMTRLNLIAAAMTVAAEWRVSRVVWPVAADDADMAARISEQAQLVEQSARAEGIDTPPIALPLLQAGDAQVVSLGRHLDVPWHTAWSCLHDRPAPCGTCAGCLRRREAFHEAGVEDPSIARRAVMA
jgi:7-cyano-7-deazaguanine synthase